MVVVLTVMSNIPAWGAEGDVPATLPTQTPEAAADTTVPEPKAGAPVPPGLRVRAELSRDSILLGENPLLYYVVTNAGQQPFKISLGGDYRGAPRALRFIVRATDKDGTVVEDPYPDSACMGGLGGTFVVKPGQTFYLSVPLLRHCRFEKAGTYTIQVMHDLGWFASRPWGDPKERKGEFAAAVTATAQIKVAEPTPQQAEQVLQQILAMPPLNNQEWGKKTPEYPDLTVLRSPVYLPLLMARVDGGLEAIIEGIGSIETPEATTALLKVLGHKDAAKAQAAAQCLLIRIPTEGTPYTHWGNERTVQRCWDRTVADQARTAAQTILTHVSEPLYTVAGHILAVTAEKDDLAWIVKAVDQALANHPGARNSDQDYLDAPGDTNSLLIATQRCIKSGAAVTTPPNNPGEVVVYLTHLGANASFRPPGWEAACASFLAHKHPYVRQLALHTLPSPMPEACRKALPSLLADDDEGVLMEACTRAGQEKDAACRPGLLKVLGAPHGSFVVGNAQQASVPLGIYPEALEIAADRLSRTHYDPHAQGTGATSIGTWMFLMSVVEGATGSGGFSEHQEKDFPAIARRWKEFIAAHREALREGKKFPLGEGGITPAFVPTGADCTVHGKSWPER